jgi:poly-gamma-glutamate capsule biosynthesis protein CapA/YwtB (metallophosphatase superfamily)
MSDPGSPRPKPPRIWFGAGFAVLVAIVLFAVFVRTGSGPAAPADAGNRTAQRPSGPATSAGGTPSASPEAKGSLLIHGAGDVNVDPSYVTSYASEGYGYAWSGLDGLFRDDDLTVVNLECAVSKVGTAVPKEFNFRGDPAALPAMRKGGVDVANMGNNHSYDFGPDALVDTRKNLVDAGVDPVGAGKDAQEALSPAILHANGWTIAVVGLDEVVDPPEAVAGPHTPGTAAGHDFPAMLDAVKAAAAESDLVVVDIHWGVELDTQPREYQVKEGHQLIDAGADVIFGGHSHRLQPLEMYEGKPIFYSLGNFVWPNFSAEGSRTGVAEVRVAPNGNIRARILPAFIEAPGHPVLTRG